jgi:hypothetical protein
MVCSVVLFQQLDFEDKQGRVTIADKINITNFTFFQIKEKSMSEMQQMNVESWNKCDRFQKI